MSVWCPLAIGGARGAARPAARHAARHAAQMGVKGSCWIWQRTCLNPWSIYQATRPTSHTNVANVGYPKIKNKLKNIFQNNKKETLLWEAHRTVQNGSLVKMSPLKQRFRTVSFPERFRTVQNGSERFWTICVCWNFLQGSERFPGTFLGAVFSHMFFPYQDF